MRKSEKGQAFSIHVPKHDELHEYEVKDAAHHLEKAQEVKANKPLHRAAKKHLKHKHKLMERAMKEK